MALHQYPHEQSSYQLLEEIGSGVSAIVYKAICPSMNSVVAIKAIDLDRSRADFDNIRQEAKTMSLLSHPNILNAHCSFTVNRCLWVVMPFMSAGSLQSIINSSFPDGLSEHCIAFVLKETLNALLYLHGQGHLHRDIKAGNILIDSDGSVKLADFGVSASIYESKPTSLSSSSSSLMLSDVAGTPYWMAPEVIHSHTGYSFKADIWSFGITALELAYGRPPLSHLPPSKSLLMRITSHFRFSDYEKNKSKSNKKFSKNFREMVASCLDQDPSKRPTAEKLLKHPFFKNCKTADFFVKNVLQGLPTVEERFKKMGVGYSLGAHEESSEEEEEESYDGTIVKHRRISGWNFNEEDLEFNPVFPVEVEAGSIKSHHEEADDPIVKRVRFGGESIIHESSPPSTTSSAEVEAATWADDPNSVSIASDMEASSGEVVSDYQPAQIETPTQVEVPDTNITTDMGASAGDLGSECSDSQMVPVSGLIPRLTRLQLSMDRQNTQLNILLATCDDVGEAVTDAETWADDPNSVSIASDMGASSGEVGSDDQPDQIETPTQVEVPDTNITTDMGASAGDLGSEYPDSQMVPVSGLLPRLTELQLNLKSQKTLLNNLLASCGDVGEAVRHAEISPEKQLLRRVAELMIELDQEKRKSASLEMQLDFLRKKYMTEGSSNTKTNDESDNEGPGSSSV